MSDANNERAKHADTIVRNHVIWSMGAGLIPVLIADIFAVSALQLDMIRQLSRVYSVDFSETQGKAIVTSLTGATVARLTARSVVKLLPGVGSLIGGVTVSVFAGASTYALGEVFKKHFESGGTILDFDPERVKKLYKEQFEKGKKIVKDLRKNEGDKTAGPTEEAGGFTMRSKPSTSAQTGKPDAPPSDAPEDKADILARLKEIGDLKNAGIITEEEFEQIKKRLIENF